MIVLLPLSLLLGLPPLYARQQDTEDSKLCADIIYNQFLDVSAKLDEVRDARPQVCPECCDMGYPECSEDYLAAPVCPQSCSNLLQDICQYVAVLLQCSEYG